MTAQERITEWAELADTATVGSWEESWREVPGCDGYEVSDFGNVRSYYVKGNHRAENKRSPYPRVLARRVRSKSTGYPTVQLPNPESGKYQTRAIHHLVALAFIGPRPTGMHVAHLNGDSSDARLMNLAYVTPKENEAHKIAHGTSGHGERNANAKLQGWQVSEVKYLAEKGVSQGKIAALFDLNQGYVAGILRGESWGNVSARTAVPAMAAALTAVLALHRAITIYDECDCTDEQKETGHEDIYEVGTTCNLLYVICDECCRADIYQTEDCADYHDHKPDEAICPTVAAIETALAVTP